MTFAELCCGRPRGYLPQRGAPSALIDQRSLIVGVLICSRCDYEHDKATAIPREHAIKDLRPRP